MFKLFEALHELLPWWGTIAAATLAARLLMSPMVVYSQSKGREEMERRLLMRSACYRKRRSHEPHDAGDAGSAGKLPEGTSHRQSS